MMTKTEARKNIIKTNRLRNKIERLVDRLWRKESVGSRGFKLCQERLKEAQNEIKEGAEEHRAALRVFLVS